MSHKLKNKCGNFVQQFVYNPWSCMLFHCTDLSETHSHSLNICGYHLCQIASEPDKEM